MNDSIRAYIDRAPAAISGQRGHYTTLRVARTLYNGFGLCRDQVLESLWIYNRRLSEKRTERELAIRPNPLCEGRMTNRVVGCSPDTTPRREESPFVPQKTQAAARKSPKKVCSRHGCHRYFPYLMHVHTRTRRAPGVSEESVANVADSPKAGGIEARRIAAELVKLHRDGAITSDAELDAMKKKLRRRALNSLPISRQVVFLSLGVGSGSPLKGKCCRAMTRRWKMISLLCEGGTVTMEGKKSKRGRLGEGRPTKRTMEAVAKIAEAVAIGLTGPGSSPSCRNQP